MKSDSFWSYYAKFYDRFMKKDKQAYRTMNQYIRTAVRGKVVLELATGTGLISKSIVSSAAMIEATDLSKEMIELARSSCNSSKIHFSVQDMFSLPYADESFPVIIASNVLHIIPNPQKALDEMRRVLTPDGLIIVPTFTHGNSTFVAKVRARFMKLIGFPLKEKWSSEEYIEFLRKNGWKTTKTAIIKASFPLTYVECVKDSNQ